MEYPGWDVQFVYYTHSGANFSGLFSNLNNVAYDGAVKSETFDKNFANESLHSNLKIADKIMFVIYDERDQAREQLIFQGSGDITSWFSAQYLVKSVHWETSKLVEASSFKFKPSSADFQFEITTNSESMCGESGFFKITCDVSTECEDLKWWARDATLDKKPCGILYSKWTLSVDYSVGYWASRIQIISKPDWEKVFMFESFAGIHPYQYYQSGIESNPAGGDFHKNMVFRDSDIEGKIKSANFIWLMVFDKQKIHVASDVVFKADGDFETWFQRENIETSSLWGGFEVMDSPDSRGGTNFTLSPVAYRSFYINRNWGGCENDAGWLMVTFSNGSSECWWEDWWGLPGFEAKDKTQPPFILYSSTKGPQLVSKFHQGGKIELFVA